MKTLVLFFVLLVLSINSFCQNSLTQDEILQLQQIHNYPEYVKFCNDHKITPKSETTWIFDVTYLEDYKLRQDMQEIKSTIISSGAYLIKARNHIIEGWACQIVSGGVFYIGSTTYANAVDKALLLK